MKRKVSKQVHGYLTKDGAGVHLIRVLGHDTVKEFSPILLLDSFDSYNPSDYTAGFPLHPHRGMETISYVSCGSMIHKDSLGHEDMISDGEVQWMTAGLGILHEEKVPSVKRLLGVQLWLNLPAKDKMTHPEYHSIKNSEIKEIAIEGGKIRLLAGRYKNVVGYQSKYLPLDYYDIHLQQNASIDIETVQEDSIMIFTLLGDIEIEGELIKEKTAVKLTTGDSLKITSQGQNCQVLFIRSIPLDESVVWNGPIVMNTKEQLNQALDDLIEGNFLQKEILYEEKGEKNHGH